MALLYAGAVNVLVGAPEAGKTLCAGGMAADELFSGGRVLWIDLDHNGARALLARLLAFGVDRAVLADRSRFRLCLPEDAESVAAIVDDAASWGPSLAVVDSVGELLPMFGANSNDADDYTRVNRAVMASLARYGVGVLAIDHEAKSLESRAYGATGSAAKKRAVDGALLRVTNVRPFAPGEGGTADLSVIKDRHGSLRALGSGREPTVAVFSMWPTVGGSGYRFEAPEPFVKPPSDVEQLAALVPAPSSQRDVQRRMGWGGTRANNALRLLRERSGSGGGASAPLLPSPIGGAGERRPGALDARQLETVGESDD